MICQGVLTFSSTKRPKDPRQTISHSAEGSTITVKRTLEDTLPKATIDPQNETKGVRNILIFYNDSVIWISTGADLLAPVEVNI